MNSAGVALLDRHPRCSRPPRTLSKEVAALQNAQAKSAILYSHAATIADERHIVAREDAYMALNLSGVPVGFITDEQVAAGLLGNYRCLVASGAKASSKAAIDKIREWVANGGLLITYGEGNLVEDEYGRPLEPPQPVLELQTRESNDLESLRDEVSVWLDLNGLGPELKLYTEQGRLPFRVEWRAAKLDGHTLINTVNYGRRPVTVRLPEGSWRNLISNDDAGETIVLKPETPILLVTK